MNLKKLLIIAGSDSGGGAGIQADIKTACAHKIFATTAITALTAQNTMGVSHVTDTHPDMVAAQINAVLTDIGTDAVKIGMLSNTGIIKAVYSGIKGLNCPIVLDTVMLAKGGAALLNPDAVNELKTLLLPLATIVTPNIPEAEALADMKITNIDGMIEAGRNIMKLGARAVLVKGGHLEGSRITDVLLVANDKQLFVSERIDTPNTHGTGCTLASAIACNLAKGISLADSVRRARDYVYNAILTAPDIGNGHGPLNHLS